MEDLDKAWEETLKIQEELEPETQATINEYLCGIVKLSVPVVEDEIESHTKNIQMYYSWMDVSYAIEDRKKYTNYLKEINNIIYELNVNPEDVITKLGIVKIKLYLTMKVEKK